MYIVMLGAPGAGKGTQADILSQEMDLPHIASGDLFRQALEKRTNVGLSAKGYMDKGELVPDEITIKMILERIDRPDCASGCLFDGFPRTLQQAKVLDKALEDKGKIIDRAIYIEVPNEELVKRLSGRWLCRACQTPYHITNSPPRTPGKCDKCGGELYQRRVEKLLSHHTECTILGRNFPVFSISLPPQTLILTAPSLSKQYVRLNLHHIKKTQ